MKKSQLCQDYCDCCELEHEVIVAVASDGAGSAQYARVASQLVCSLVIKEIKKFFDEGNKIETMDKDYFQKVLENIKKEISECAKKSDSKLREYACTLMISVVGKEYATFFQIGDGAIVVTYQKEPDDYKYIFWPQRGEYENTTYFITDKNAASKCQFIATDSIIDKFAIITDGLQGMALHYKTKSVHSPFFNLLFKYLVQSKDGNDEISFDSLKKFLNLPQVNERTDDDKTLVIALRNLEQKE